MVASNQLACAYLHDEYRPSACQLAVAQFRYLTNLIDNAVHGQPKHHVQLMLTSGVLSIFFLDTGLCQSSHDPSLQIYLPIIQYEHWLKIDHDAVPVEVVFGPTAVWSSPHPVASPAQQKQLNIYIHPACIAGQLSSGMINHAVSVRSLPVESSLDLHDSMPCMYCAPLCMLWARGAWAGLCKQLQHDPSRQTLRGQQVQIVNNEPSSCFPAKLRGSSCWRWTHSCRISADISIMIWSLMLWPTLCLTTMEAALAAAMKEQCRI